MSSSEGEQRLVVALPSGASVDVSAAVTVAADARALAVIAPGAGAAYDHPFLRGLADGLRDAHVSTVRINFPYREAGRRMPGPAAHAIATWVAAFAFAGTVTDLPVWAMGKSYGGRMASMAAAEGAITPAGLVYLGYPLHPPGDPAKLRAAHLPSIPMPQLFLSGTKDPFVDPHEQLEVAVASCPSARIEWVEGGGHSFEVAGRRRAADAIGADLAPLVAQFLMP
ncbi:alpha/beta family hydrolase [Microbacterium sp. P01]|uniref:alpha/beta hydrolase family protein n=1 Tax=unclassified Microbacterium TaxID=2609290 RepID=UPI00366FBD3D